jgi:adenylate cyclase class 2
MYEVELKVRAAHGPVREALESRGATPVGRVHQHDTYYDAPHRDFAETDEALRLRRETREEGSDGSAGGRGTADPTTRLTYKGPLVESASKTREEHETGIGDPDAADALLGALGFSPAAVVEKSRERFACGEYAVVLDTLPELGEFVEVEREASEGEVAAAREGAAELLGELGRDPTEQIRTSYLELALDRRSAGTAQSG